MATKLPQKITARRPADAAAVKAAAEKKKKEEAPPPVKAPPKEAVSLIDEKPKVPRRKLPASLENKPFSALPPISRLNQPEVVAPAPGSCCRSRPCGCR